jgi:membrane-associated phospholipid phosphatase
MRPAANVLGMAIILSTMLLKQHSCIDVVLGAALAFALDAAASSLERSGDVRRVPQRL